MSETRKGKDLPSRPNRVSEFVLSKIDRFERLNAPTLEEGDAKFRAALKSILPESRVGEQIGFGGDFSVHRLVDDEHTVVKRLNTVEDAAQVDLDEYWQKFIVDHKIAEKYFGRRFIPYTEFVALDTSLGHDLRHNSGILDGREYVMVQERAKGDRYSAHSDLPTISPKLKTEMVEFIKRYERMMREEGAVLEHIDLELMIDYTEGTIKALDTNYFVRLDGVHEDNAKALLETFHIDPTSIQTSTDLINSLIAAMPELESLRDKDYQTVMARLNTIDGDLYRTVYNSLWQRFDTEAEPYGFEDLVTIADNLSPQGYHPRVIRDLMKRFEIVETDLAEE